eukprot:496476-Pyramimonas_sp.AAC.1
MADPESECGSGGIQTRLQATHLSHPRLIRTGSGKRRVRHGHATSFVCTDPPVPVTARVHTPQRPAEQLQQQI